MENLHIIQANSEDCEALAPFAARMFTHTFGHLYRPENLADHLARAYSAATFREALAAGDTILLMKSGDAILGYAKVGHVALPVAPPPPAGAVEIHRVYIDDAHHGKGLGKQLMLHVLSLPQVQLAPIVYLGVWEENLRAQALYAQYGFTQVGRYLYQVGDQFDRELILARRRT